MRSEQQVATLAIHFELQKVVHDAELGQRWADKLMKVGRHTSEEQIVLIHNSDPLEKARRRWHGSDH